MIFITESWELWAGAGLVLTGFSLFLVGLICAKALYGYSYRSGWQDAQAALARAPQTRTKESEMLRNRLAISMPRAAI